LEQLQTLPAAAAVAQQLGFNLQIACPPSGKDVWSLLAAVEKLIPFAFDDASLADWTNLLGCVREPDFQLCFNLASGRQVDLMLSMSHIPTRVAASGFSATQAIALLPGGWRAQALEPWLRSVGVNLQAGDFRLSLPADALAQASAALPAGDGPVLLLAPTLYRTTAGSGFRGGSASACPPCASWNWHRRAPVTWPAAPPRWRAPMWCWPATASAWSLVFTAGCRWWPSAVNPPACRIVPRSKVCQTRLPGWMAATPSSLPLAWAERRGWR
jgi:hypothetical protein